MITLHREGHPPFVATVHGTRRDATPRELRRLAARHPLAPLAASARIRRQGIALYARGMRPEARPDHHQEGVS